MASRPVAQPAKPSPVPLPRLRIPLTALHFRAVCGTACAIRCAVSPAARARTRQVPARRGVRRVQARVPGREGAGRRARRSDAAAPAASFQPLSAPLGFVDGHNTASPAGPQSDVRLRGARRAKWTLPPRPGRSPRSGRRRSRSTACRCRRAASEVLAEAERIESLIAPAERAYARSDLFRATTDVDGAKWATHVCILSI